MENTKIRASLIVCLVAIGGWLDLTECQAQRSSGLETATGLHSSRGLDKASGLNPALKLDSMASPAGFSSIPYRNSSVSGLNPNRVPILPNSSPELYKQAKLAIREAGLPSMLRDGGVGVLVARDDRIKPGSPFVMEYTGYIENGESVYFVPRGMTDPFKIERYQILDFLIYPPKEVLSQKNDEDIKWMEEWMIYAKRKMDRHIMLRSCFEKLIQEAVSFPNQDQENSQDSGSGSPG